MANTEELKKNLAALYTETEFRLEPRTLNEILQGIEAYTQNIPFASKNQAHWNDFWYSPEAIAALNQLYQDLSLGDGLLPVQQSFLLAFLRMLETPKTLMNTLPARHRSLYYHELLGFSRHAAKPDRVAVNFTLQKPFTEYVLASGTELDAGQDNQGNTLVYLTDELITVTGQKLEKLCWTRKDSSDAWLFCTALDTENNIELPAEGIRLFSATDNETELTTDFLIPLPNLSGEVKVIVDWPEKSPGTEHRPAMLLLEYNRAGTLLCAESVGLRRTLYRFPSDLKRNRSGCDDGLQLALQYTTRPSRVIPGALNLVVTDSPDIRYDSPNGYATIDSYSYPFGSQPRQGNAFTLTLPAAFTRVGGELIVTPVWCDLPDRSFPDWYADYPDKPAGNDAFIARVTLLYPDGSQQQLADQALFSGTDVPQPQSLRLSIPSATLQSELAVRVELQGQDFYHAAWQQDPSGKNPPWTPQVSRIETVFQQSLLAPESPTVLALRETDVTPEQALYLAVGGAAPLENISLYWSLNAPASPELSWFYYSSAAAWAPLDADLHDMTANLANSGLWQAMLPADILPGGDGLEEEFFWLKALLPGGTEISASQAPKIRAVNANAVTATRYIDVEADENPDDPVIAADTIRQLVYPIAEISRVNQPAASEAGKKRETESELLARAATRIGHRERAITWANMRSMLMDNYPQIYDVRFPDVAELNRIPAQEHPQLLIVPDTRYSDNDDALRPGFSAGRLTEMSRWLSQYTSLWSLPALIAPKYVDVTASFSVRFVSGINPDYGYRQIINQLQESYMPWSINVKQSATPGNRIDYFGLIANIQQSPLVETVLSLTLAYNNANPVQESIVAADDEVLILLPVAA